MSGVKRRGLDSKNPKLGHVGTIVNIFYPLTVFFCWGGGEGVPNAALQVYRPSEKIENEKHRK